MVRRQPGGIIMKKKISNQIHDIANEVADMESSLTDNANAVFSLSRRLAALQAELANEISRFKSSTALPSHYIFLLTEMLERSKIADQPAPHSVYPAHAEKIEGYDIPREAIEAASMLLETYIGRIDGIDFEFAVRIVLRGALPYFVPKERAIAEAPPPALPETDADFRARILPNVAEQNLNYANMATGDRLDRLGSKYGLKRRGLSSDKDEPGGQIERLREVLRKVHADIHVPGFRSGLAANSAVVLSAETIALIEAALL
jgi:hypothetical protein